MNNHYFYLINQFALKNNIKIVKEEAKIQLLSHPYYPSLKSITDLFDYFNIDNLALKVNDKLDTFPQIPESFLAQINEDNDNRLVLVTKEIDTVILIYDEHRSKSLSVDEFLKLWTGIIIVIEKSENKNINKLHKTDKVKLLVYILSFIFLLSIFIQAKPSLFQFLYFSLSCIGVYFSYLITIHEFGFHSKILDKFCSEENKNSNCEAVLNSKGATIFGLFKLSDAGIVYFTTMVLTSLLLALSSLQTFTVIFLISTFAIPFTLYSLYYQWKIVKNWCPLCLTVIGVLWLQFGTLFLNNSFWEHIYVIDFSFMFFMASFLTITSLWIIIKPLMKMEHLYKKLEIEHIKFKRNFKLFNAALSINPILDTVIPSANGLVFGNKKSNSLLKIILITNPMCGFCKESHRVIEKILKNENPEIQISIRFNVQPNKEDKGTKIAAKILEIYYTTNEKNSLYALSDIYSEMDPDTWLKKWGKVIEEEYLITLKQEKEWCNKNKINFTPALLINGKQFPKEYGKLDLLYFIDELIEEQEVLENSQTNFVESL